MLTLMSLQWFNWVYLTYLLNIPLVVCCSLHLYILYIHTVILLPVNSFYTVFIILNSVLVGCAWIIWLAFTFFISSCLRVGLFLHVYVLYFSVSMCVLFLHVYACFISPCLCVFYFSMSMCVLCLHVYVCFIFPCLFVFYLSMSVCCISPCLCVFYFTMSMCVLFLHVYVCFISLCLCVFCLFVFLCVLYLHVYVCFIRQINNPDMRVQILKQYVKENFPATPLLDYAMEVEKITTSKVSGVYTRWTCFCCFIMTVTNTNSHNLFLLETKPYSECWRFCGSINGRLLKEQRIVHKVGGLTLRQYVKHLSAFSVFVLLWSLFLFFQFLNTSFFFL